MMVSQKFSQCIINPIPVYITHQTKISLHVHKVKGRKYINSTQKMKATL